ncbi:MAG: hypothetical protein EXQ58_10760 [Acidobacteria bacterium]|nr:hypothetical protein [Acidobacteriota bacterium]
MKRWTGLVVLALVAIPLPLAAQDKDLESFHVEVTAAVWWLGATGQVQSGNTAVDLKSDLGIGNSKVNFLGKLVLKPARKHRVLFEVIPYRLEGDNTLARTIDFGGQAYMLQDRITSNAEINFVFGGYQYDAVSRSQWHFGVLFGAAYLNAKGAIRSATLNRQSSEEVTVPLPLVGAEFRGFPARESRLFNINGEIKGMAF